MATVIISLKIMPESPDVDMDALQKLVDVEIRKFGELNAEEEVRITVEPIAFGLKALIVLFAMDESKGSTEPLENALNTLEGVNSVEVTDVRRAIG